LAIQIENSYGNDTRNLREHYKNIKLQFGEIRGMGLDRFETLWRALNPSIEEIRQICDILHETFNNYLDHVEVCVVDESVIGYQPGSKAKKEAESRGEPIPVVYIPRKPHPNGLEIFLVATSVEHPARQNKGLLFIVDMYPHRTRGDSNPQETFEFFMNFGYIRTNHIGLVMLLLALSTFWKKLSNGMEKQLFLCPQITVLGYGNCCL
jgi:hypothetical protein